MPTAPIARVAGRSSTSGTRSSVGVSFAFRLRLTWTLERLTRSDHRSVSNKLDTRLHRHDEAASWHQYVAGLYWTQEAPMFEPKFAISNAILVDLTRIEGAIGFMSTAHLSDDWIRDMQANALTLEAHYTTHIEGTQLTLEQSTQLLAGQTIPDANPNDARELLNYRTAFELVAEYVGSGEPITEVLIREIHNRLVTDVRGGSAAPGQYRLGQNLVVDSVTKETVYTPPPAEEVQPLMNDLVKWLNADTGLNVVLVSGIAQFQLVHIHPFIGGNGRTARLLATLVMYRGNYDFKRLFTFSEFYDRDPSAYYGALQRVRSHDMDMTGWLEYYVGGLATQMEEVQTRGERAG